MQKTVIRVLFVCLMLSLPLAAKKYPDYARHGMVVSTNVIASEIGRDILKQGGNAVDAAVATGLALAVVNPSAGNIGGGGFMVIHLADGTVTTIGYREKAPAAAHERMYLDDDGNLVRNLNHLSPLAVGVPGTVAGFAMALERYGTMTFAQVAAPAIRLAETGFPLSHDLYTDFMRLADAFAPYPASVRKFKKPDGSFFEMGDVWQQPDLAATLKRIAANGRDGFYAGKTAELFEQGMAELGGLITAADLAAYEAVEREPIHITYRGHDVYAMAPPSSGGITLSIMLNILEGYDLTAMGHNSAAYLHHLAEAMRRAYSNRAQYIGDPAFNPGMPVERLISKDHAAALRATIDPRTASVSDAADFTWALESEETTHFSVVDADGNAVSNTYTLEYGYGSRIVLPGLGFLLNNEMGDFNPVPGRTDSTGLIGTEPNRIRPGKRMLSSMTPTIVAKDGKPWFLIGSPGGRTIINTVLQCVLNAVDFDMNVYDAVDAARAHHQWLPDYLWVERLGISPDTRVLLQERGHRLRFRGAQGRAMGIMIDPETGLRMGAADPRSPDGGAAGY